MSDSKWALAERTAAGLQDNGVSTAMRRYFTVVFPAVVIVCTLIGAAIAWMIFDRDEEWFLYLVFGLTLSCLVSGVAAFVHAHRKVTPMVAPKRASVLMLLGPDDAKDVQKQATGRRPVDAQKVQVVRAVAIQMRPSLALHLMVGPASLLFFAAQLFLAQSWGIRLLDLLVVGMFSFAIFLGARQFRATSKVLQATKDAESVL